MKELNSERFGEIFHITFLMKIQNYDTNIKINHFSNESCCLFLGWLRRLYEKTRLPIVPIYGIFPVKMK